MLRFIPNIITSLRICGTAFLLFIQPFTPLFYAVYTLSGLSDVLDGFIARKTGNVSEFGTKLDSVADLMFYTVMLLRIMPVLIEKLPVSVWIAIAVILLIRIAAYITAAVKYRRFASQHTWLNKATGGGVFAVAYFIKLPFAIELCWVVCAIACCASLEELLIHIRNKSYHPRIKSIFQKV